MLVRISALRVLALLIVAGLLASACTVQRGGRPGRAPAEELPQASAGLPDRRTVDPCSLIRPEKLQVPGVQGTATASQDIFMHRCSITFAGGAPWLTLDTGGRARLDALRGYEPDMVNVRDGVVRVPRTITDGGPRRCQQNLVLVDAQLVTVTAWAAEPGAGRGGDEAGHGSGTPGATDTGTLCRLSKAAAAEAIGTIADDAAAHWRVPENSLLGIQACELLSADVLRTVPGLDDTAPKYQHLGLDCLYGGRHEPSTAANSARPHESGQGAVPGVRVLAHLYPPMKQLRGYPMRFGSADGRAAAARFRAAGDGSLAACSTVVDHQPFTPQPEYHEVVEVTVNAALPKDRLCALSKSLAARAARGLPER